VLFVSSVEPGVVTCTDSISVLVTVPGTGSSTISRIAVSTCGAGADSCFCFRDRAFRVAAPRVTFLASILAAFLDGRFAILDAPALGRFFAIVFDFPLFDLVTPVRRFLLAIRLPPLPQGNSESLSESSSEMRSMSTNVARRCGCCLLLTRARATRLAWRIANTPVLLGDQCRREKGGCGSAKPNPTCATPSSLRSRHSEAAT
jgi:hypothetical protein